MYLRVSGVLGLQDKVFAVAQLLGETGDAAAAPRLNCNYGKLLYYVRNCVSIERAIFRAVKLV